MATIGNCHMTFLIEFLTQTGKIMLPLYRITLFLQKSDTLTLGLPCFNICKVMYIIFITIIEMKLLYATRDARIPVHNYIYLFIYL